MSVLSLCPLTLLTTDAYVLNGKDHDTRIMHFQVEPTDDDFVQFLWECV